MVEGIEEEDDEADQSVVPEEVMEGECERATTVMMINKKTVDRDTIKMVAKSMEPAFARLISVEDLSQSNGKPSIDG